MEFNYQLEERDFLNFQLYFASKSPQIKKQRSTARILGAIVLFLMAILFFATNERFEAYYFLASTVIILMVYPYLSALALKYSFKKFVKNNYREECPKSIRLKIDHATIESIEEKGHSKFDIRDLTKITEIKNYFFIHTDEITAIIIPKNQLENTDNIRNYLSRIADDHNIPFDNEPNWKFK
ncbi:YcxB family protein [Dysgonomonas sp. ZJ279]|uniref:YcxB family protein n=1 Tax=Dysgonomonas sp. ZJ279 TaxID=2709796 RepID=UPI0013EAD83B|nr:YcxB family protein [Dysgonomonas sp. ZJ279]